MNLAQKRRSQHFNFLAKDGMLVTLEGVDGCGKTATLNLVKKILARHHTPVVYTKQPSGTPLGAKIRKQILNPKNYFNNHQLMDLFQRAREDLTQKVLLPNLKKKRLVICDRYILSNMAYQGHYYQNKDKQLLDKQKILDKALFHSHYFIMPDLTFYIQTSLSTNEKRLQNRTNKQDKFDKMLRHKKAMQELRANYQSSIQVLFACDSPVLIINGDLPVEQRAEKIADNILSLCRVGVDKTIANFIPGE